MEPQKIYKERFISKLVELGFKIQDEGDNTFRLNLNKDGLNPITVKLIASEPISKRKHGSKNDIKIQAIGYFRFILSTECKEPNFYTFAFSNSTDRKIEFAIIQYEDLKNRLNARKRITRNNEESELKFWMMPERMVLETSCMGCEGEFWLVGGRMAENTDRDYTQYLNHWEQLCITV